MKGIGAASLDAWPGYGLENIPVALQTSRVKFGVHFDRVMFGMAWFGVDSPVFSAVEGLHRPLFVKDATVQMHRLSRDDFDQVLIPSLAPTMLNKFLLHVGVSV